MQWPAENFQEIADGEIEPPHVVGRDAAQTQVGQCGGKMGAQPVHPEPSAVAAGGSG